MAVIFDTEFIEISITVFLRIEGVLAFDIYIRRGDNAYTKLFPKAEMIDPERLKDYQDKKKVESLFVQKEDYKQYLFYVDEVAKKFFQNPDTVTAEELVDVVNEMINLTGLEIIVNHRVDQKSVGQAITAVRGCMEVLSKDPKSVVKVLKYLTRHSYTIKHSIMTSVFAIMLARKEKLVSEKTLINVGLGALLHDIGMSHLTFDAETKAELSPQEWKEIREHPHLGKRILDSIKNIGSEVASIVLQHHEQPNGMGYPNGLHDREIYMPAKIIAICDSFSALTSKRPYREQAFTPLKALEIMNEDRGKFDLKLLSDFETFFVGVKTK